MSDTIEQSFLIVRVGLFTPMSQVRDYFNAFGKVNKVTAIHYNFLDYIGSYPVLEYTRCVQVDMTLKSDAEQAILHQKYHVIGHLKVKVKRFLGRDAHIKYYVGTHEHEHEHEVVGFGTDAYLAKFIDKTFNLHDLSVCRLDLGKKGGILTGDATIRFAKRKHVDEAGIVAAKKLALGGTIDCDIYI